MSEKLKRPVFWFFFGWIFFPVLLNGQQNPFELSPRLKVSKDTAAEKNAATGNPFDIREDIPLEKPEPAPIAPQIQQRPSGIQPLSETHPDSAFLFGVILTMLILLTLLVTLLRPVIGKVYKAFINDNLLNQLHREQGAVVLIPYRLLYFMFLFNAGVFLYLILKYLKVELFESYWWMLLACMAIVSGIFILKHFAIAFLGWVFPIEKEMRVYSFTIVVFNIMTGILLVPFNIAISYGSAEIINGAVYGAVGLLLVIYLFRSLRALFVGGRFIAVHKFHFLLYLCAVEVAPVLVLIKLISLNSGFQLPN